MIESAAKNVGHTVLFLFIVVVVAIAAIWFMQKFGYSSNDDEPGISDDSVIFSGLSQKVTEEQIESYLDDKAGAALKDSGRIFYEEGIRYDIDPAFAVAVARKATSLGKSTCAGAGSDCNNFFCKEASSEDAGNECYPWANYDSPEDSIESFYRHIKNEYVRNGQDTISEIGCHPVSGFDSNCYCVLEDSSYCPDWVEGDQGVPAFTDEIRNYH